MTRHTLTVASELPLTRYSPWTAKDRDQLVCACSTCHVIVKEGFDSLSEASENEEDMLDNAPGVTLQSRLACQAVADGSSDLVVEIPHWNRNLVSEGH